MHSQLYCNVRASSISDRRGILLDNSDEKLVLDEIDLEQLDNPGRKEATVDGG